MCSFFIFVFIFIFIFFSAEVLEGAHRKFDYTCNHLDDHSNSLFFTRNISAVLNYCKYN